MQSCHYRLMRGRGTSRCARTPIHTGRLFIWDIRGSMSPGQEGGFFTLLGVFLVNEDPGLIGIEKLVLLPLSWRGLRGKVSFVRRVEKNGLFLPSSFFLNFYLSKLFKFLGNLFKDRGKTRSGNRFNLFVAITRSGNRYLICCWIIRKKNVKTSHSR